MRLDKAISKFYNVSRSQSRKLILKGSVMVNGEKNKDISFSISFNDSILVNQKKIEYFHDIYIILNKPGDYVCTREKNEGKTVFDLINTNYSKEMSVCGRLDKDTEGLLILSNDGSFIHNVISPKKNIDKEYLVTLKNIITNEREELISGINISDNEFVKAKSITLIDNYNLKITITEGKYHQVKRMFKAVNNEVEFLKRIRIGYLYLPEKLELGQWIKVERNDIYQKVFKKNAP